MGEHLKKKRLELKLTQREAGQRLGVSIFTVMNWEYGVRKPAIRYFPPIHQFLGYDPAPPRPDSMAERLRAKRRELGWSQKEAARRLGVNPSTWSGWERGGTITAKTHRRVVATFVGVEELEAYVAMRKERRLWTSTTTLLDIQGLASCRESH